MSVVIVVVVVVVVAAAVAVAAAAVVVAAAEATSVRLTIFFLHLGQLAQRIQNDLRFVQS